MDILIFIAVIILIFFLVRKYGKKLPGRIAGDKRKKLIQFGNHILAKLEKISEDTSEEFPNITDHRLVYFHLKEIHGSRVFKVVVLSNHEDLFQELENEIFDIYIDLEKPDLFFIDLQKIVNDKGNIFYIPR